ncbi:MAG: F0F1 ATP synthase subunit beta, partial [Nitrospirae bacterium]|nr:F0F1 ATP synthase subunit beta [Nitrospirota bacterium]
MSDGRISQVIGVVVDVEFEKGAPDILNALRIDEAGDPSKGVPEVHLTLETVAHLGDNKVRALAMGTTDGVVRGMKVVDMGKPISVPVGKPVLGRIVNVLGEPIDEMGPVQTTETMPIHRLAPDFTEQ